MDPYVDKNKPEGRRPEHKQVGVYQEGSIERTIEYPSLGVPVHLRRLFGILQGRPRFR